VKTHSKGICNQHPLLLVLILISIALQTFKRYILI